VLKNVTITLNEDALHWARRQAADQGTSVSKFVGKVIEDRMRSADGYRRAFATVKRIKPIPGFDASKRVPREQLYDRP
jgi:hypothetical protein